MNKTSDATHRHLKRGTEYVLIGVGKMQAENWLDCDPGPIVPWGKGKFVVSGKIHAEAVDMREVAVYRSATDPTEIWVRPREEFEDGRFELRATPAPDPQPEVAAEPVAWRGDGHAEDENFRRFTAIKRVAEIWAEQGLTVTPLYATPPVVEEAVKAEREAAQFLIDRLDDFERGSLGDDIEDACRDFDGHVSPAIERLRDMLSAPSALSSGDAS